MNSSSVASATTISSFLALNDDVLRDFFEIVSDIDPPYYRDYEIINPGEARFRPGWIHLTHVNQRWRRVLLAMPSLWAKVFSIMPESALKEILSRAGDASLHITLDGKSKSHHEKLIMLALANIERVRALSKPDAFDWVSTLHNQYLPELVTLDVLQDQEPASDLRLWCPNLRDCALHRMPAQFVAPSLRRLVMRGDPALPNSVSNVLDTLASLPHLEELELELLARKPLVWGNDQRSSVTLAHLRSIALIGTLTSDMISFWHKLALPSNLENMRITYRRNTTDWGPILDTFAPYLARETYNALAFRDGDAGSLELCAFAFSGDDPAAWNPSAPRRGTFVGIAPRYDMEEEDEGVSFWEQVLPSMLSPLKARPGLITHLLFQLFNRYDLGEMSGSDRPIRTMLRNELRTFTSVTAVSGTVFRFEFDILAVSDNRRRRTAGEAENDQSAKFLPELTSLVVRVDPSQSRAHWEMVLAVLESRAHAKIPIQRLELIGPMFPANDHVTAVHERGLAHAKSLGLREFVDRRVPFNEWQVRGPGFDVFHGAPAYMRFAAQ